MIDNPWDDSPGEDGGHTDASCVGSPYEIAAVDYRTRLGWTVYTVGAAVWLTLGASIEAFDVPRVVGEQALARLRARGHDIPVINVPGPLDRWALLTRPHAGPRDGVLDLLAGHDVGYAYLGHHHGRSSEWGVDLPPTRHPGHEPLSWITPADTPLPAVLTVAQVLADIGPGGVDG